MSSMRKKDPWYDQIKRTLWRSMQTANVITSGLTASASASGQIKIFYGGARTGDVGGPLVKVKRLREHFPESKWSYNLVYALSNAAYLSENALNLIKKRRIPIVLNQNGVFYPGWYEGDWQKMNAQMALAYHRADYVFWQTEFCRRTAQKYLGPREGAGEVLFNAVDTLKFRPSHGSRDRPFTFLLTGNIDAHLSYRILSAVAGLRSARDAGFYARLVIAGRAVSGVVQAVKQSAKKLGLEEDVDFLGAYTHSAAPEIYQNADAYIMMKYLDSCPNTVLEAMASGLPVLYSESGGVPELVGPTAGIGLKIPECWEETSITPPPEEIGKGMIDVMERVSDMSRAARQRAERKFDIINWIERHRQIFINLMER